MTLYTITKNHKIIAEKRPDELYDVYDAAKNIFGDSWDKKLIQACLTKKQIADIKKTIKNI